MKTITVFWLTCMVGMIAYTGWMLFHYPYTGNGSSASLEAYFVYGACRLMIGACVSALFFSAALISEDGINNSK
jgi:hypothetical protein